jgi:hypothetical protein
MINDDVPANCQELRRTFESLSFSKLVASQLSHRTAFVQQEVKGNKKKGKQASGEEKIASRSINTYKKKQSIRPDAHLRPNDRKQWADRVCSHCGLKGHPYTHCLSTTYLFCNKAMVTSIYTSSEPCMLQSNTGKMLISHKAVVPCLKQDIWFDINELSNIVAPNTLSRQNRVTCDSAEG